MEAARKSGANGAPRDAPLEDALRERLFGVETAPCRQRLVDEDRKDNLGVNGGSILAKG